MKIIALTAILLFPVSAAELKPQTVQAFEQYVREAEARMNTAKSLLWADESADRRSRIQQGQVVAEPFTGKADIGIPGGLVYDWIGTVFIPGATVDETIARLEDYNNHKNIFK